MSTKGSLVLASLFLAAFVLIGLMRCGYRKIERIQESSLTEPASAPLSTEPERSDPSPIQETPR